jgi:succinate-semialdehyde dehydrogenase / glutarate-semialdehyde dehydrogenase
MDIRKKLRNPGLVRQEAYSNGIWCHAGQDITITVTNPADGSVLGTVPYMQRQDAARAVEAAHAAFSLWSAKTAKERAQLLRRWYELVLENQEDLAIIMTAEQGKPLAEARAEILYAASCIEWFAEEAKRVYGDIIPAPKTSQRIIVLRQPIGVAAAITPWNFPSAMITRKVAPALAAGCTVVIKPSEETPFSALALAVLAEKAGIPAGVFNMITGNAEEIGKEFCENPKVGKLSFTGSTPVGKLLMAQSAGTLKRLSLELGGNAPFIVFDDADLEAALTGVMASKYRNSGQTCVCANRILVQEGVFDAFARLLTEKTQELTVCSGFEEACNQGPLISSDAIEKAERLLKDALAKGAKLLTGGTRMAGKGHFFQPTVISEVTDDMAIAQEEIFAPIAALYRFKTEEEAIYKANNTRYGLASYFYARDNARIWRVAEALQYGIVGINEGLISNEVAPFGGMKESGLGREGSYMGIEEYLEVKYMCMGNVG